MMARHAPKGIDRFDGPYRFLSNFYRGSGLAYEGRHYSTVEHAYQAAKCADWHQAAEIFCAKTPALAKKLGRRATLKPDWETAKHQVMLSLLRAKFTNPAERYLLLATGDAHLEEGNTWGDVTWGTVNGKGENWLGRLLMQVREEIRDGRESVDGGLAEGGADK